MGEKSELKKAWLDMLDSFKFRYESKKGKLSLTTYLSIIGEYADRLIIESEKSGLQFVEGQCQAQILEPEKKFVQFEIGMLFSDHGALQEKTASRMIPVDRFVKSSIKGLYGGKQVFNIERPGKNEVEA